MIFKRTVTLFVLTLFVLLIIIGCSGSTEKSTQTNKQDARSNKYFKIAESKTINDALLISVISKKDLNDLELSIITAEAERIVAENAGPSVIRVVFFNPGQILGDDLPLCCFEWTEEKGLDLYIDKTFPRL